MSVALFELTAHVEVMLRNAMDHVLSTHFRDDTVGIPWFLRTPPTTPTMAETITAVRDRLRPLHRDTRHQIIAGLSFGFWSGMLGTKYDELWKECLHRAFPGSNGTRKQVSHEVEAIRKLRNRLAHHDSMLNVDVPFETRRLHRLASFLGGSAPGWLQTVDQVGVTYQQKPHTAIDTVVVPAGPAWPLYQETGVYVCQSGRAFRPVARIAFYGDRSIKTDVPQILDRRDEVPWTEAEASRLEQSSERTDRKIGRAIRQSRQQGWTGGRYQVFVLTQSDHPQHRTLPTELPNPRTGRGSAFVNRQRYVALHRLETAKTTADLLP